MKKAKIQKKRFLLSCFPYLRQKILCLDAFVVTFS
jgi:hypothetical protein